MRTFAASLGLEVGGQYTSYVPWPGDRVVTTLVATRPGEVTPAGFWFPFVGRLPYKGFFDVERADVEAGRLRDDGLDVCRVGVRAYSTLGWLDDPVTGPMLRLPQGELVETLLHELVHATVFVAGDADFNEGVASFVGEEGSVRFYQARGPAEAARRRRREVVEGRLLQAEILALRERIASLYAEAAPGAARDAERIRLEREARAAIAALPLATRDPGALAGALLLNDACLALAGTYARDTALYEHRLHDLHGDLPAFVDALRAAADAPDPRAALLGVPPGSGTAEIGR